MKKSTYQLDSIDIISLEAAKGTRRYRICSYVGYSENRTAAIVENYQDPMTNR